ncbi:hypothetical protein FZI91_00345 [Mycobacterium sp. CBMA271]|uniref:DUF6159 family protein n=1 Tax=unclassified Mycobacteroides TaxID=2618759 RepID=UPI0012DFB390|nr:MULTISPECIES: DUF6159 family protein [unclassified Mycobacteroides]MUM19983.1 hypothetical protein [Mycobacteroides sp. CBMA 326]MUM20157.1 hypothetical protein [Mycobacteroides sp. CBMA 271]
MAFFDTLSTSWQIFKTSLRVLNSRKELVLFPILSGLSTILVAAAMVIPAILLLPAPAGDDVPPLYYPVVAVAYFVLLYVATFWQAALVSQANVALEGGDPSVAAGVSTAAARGGRLAPWVLITGTVSWVISVIEERVPFIGRFLDVAWKVVSFQVLPAIVLEDLGAVAAVKKTKETLKRSWGSNVVGIAGLNIFTFLFMLPAVAVIVLAAMSGIDAVVGVAVIAGLLWILLAVIVGSALTGIYQTALYRSTVDGHLPGPFAGVDVNRIFKVKNR